MTGKRSYGDGCAAAHALDLVGERWALLVVRELMLGPKRFTDLRAGMPHASPNVVSQRLRDLEEIGVLRRRRLGPPAPAAVYELTEWGLELEPVLKDLGRWGSRSPVMPHGEELSLNSLILSLRTMFDAERAAEVETALELRLGEHVFSALVADGELAVEPGPAAAPQATVIAHNHEAFAQLVYEGRPLEAALADGDVAIEGDRKAVERFVTLFPLPEPVLA